MNVFKLFRGSLCLLWDKNKKPMRFKLIGLICLIMQCNLSCTQHIINKETVQTLDLHRYMGKWFEIARFDHRFEHNLVGATVEYSFLPNGDIEVVNSGYWGNFSGSFKRAKGIAKITDPTCPSKLNGYLVVRLHSQKRLFSFYWLRPKKEDITHQCSNGSNKNIKIKNNFFKFRYKHWKYSTYG